MKRKKNLEKYVPYYDAPDFMRKYSDYEVDDYKKPDFPWVKFKIIVETEEDKQELLKAFEHIHYANINTNFIAVNQLAHLYEDHENDPCRIQVIKKD